MAARIRRLVEMAPPSDRHGGDVVYRSTQPLAALRAHGAFGETVSVSSQHPSRRILARAADLLILSGLADPDFLPIVRERAARGLPTVYEIRDDITALPPSSPVFGFYQAPENRQLVLALIGLCSALTANNRALLARFAPPGKPTCLLPNQLAAAPPPRPWPRRLPLALGWGGSHGHYDDLCALAPLLIDLVQRHPHVRLHLMASEPIRALFASLPPERLVPTPLGSLSRYEAFLDTLDIAIMPLQDTPFNRCRSDIKAVEAMAHGAAVVAEAAEPYRTWVRHGENGLLAHGEDGWREALESLLSDPTFAARLSQQGYSDTIPARLEANAVAVREAFYLSLLSETKPEAAWPDPSALSRGEHVADCLHDGLVAWLSRRDPVYAAGLFAEAVALAPGFELPLVYQAELDPARAGDLLQTALAYEPTSVQARLSRIERATAQARFVDALHSLDALLPLTAPWDGPSRRALPILHALGRHEAAAALAAQLLTPRPHTSLTT